MTNDLDFDCQGLCEFHGRLWCREYNRPCREYIEFHQKGKDDDVVGSR